MKDAPEDQERAALGIFAQAFLRGGPQAIEAGAQVARGGGDKDLEVRVKAQHETRALQRWINGAASSI
jgi:hypothetical protein